CRTSERGVAATTDMAAVLSRVSCDGLKLLAISTTGSHRVGNAPKADIEFLGLKCREVPGSDICSAANDVSRWPILFIRRTYSPALAWPGLTAPPAPAHPVGRNVEHPGSGIVRSPGEARGMSLRHRCSGKDRRRRK